MFSLLIKKMLILSESNKLKFYSVKEKYKINILEENWKKVIFPVVTSNFFLC